MARYFAKYEIKTLEEFNRLNSLLNDGKRYRIEKIYNNMKCWECNSKEAGKKSYICKFCIKNNKQNEKGWIENISDKDIEKIYDKVKKEVHNE